MKIVLVVKDGGEIGILPPAQHLEWKHNRIKTPFLSCFSWASMKRRRWCILKDHRVVSREPQRPRRHGGVAAAALQTPESCCLSVGTSALSLKTSTGAWTGKTWRCQRFPSDSQHIPFTALLVDIWLLYDEILAYWPKTTSASFSMFVLVSLFLVSSLLKDLRSKWCSGASQRQRILI